MRGTISRRSDAVNVLGQDVVETVFSMIKARFGERLRSKAETAQINEPLTKVLCDNLIVVIQSMYGLNISPEFTSEAA